MYENLVKRLRTAQTLAEFVAEETAKTPNTIFGEAADAIEEQQRILDVYGGEDGIVAIFKERDELLKRVPAKPHGRLIDADALCDGLVSNHPVVIHASAAPTIIPAEEGELMGDGCTSCALQYTETCVRTCAEGSHYKPIPKTNADRIRAMTDEELADYAYKTLGNYCCPPKREFEANNCMGFECLKCWLDWMKQEATDGT